MPTILLKKSDTASAVPTTANLTNLAGGVEVAVNTADRRMFTMNSSSAVVELGNNPTSLNITTGNLAFTGTGQRITGDMSNATIASRLSFQTSTANGATSLNAIPNGSATTSSFGSFNSSDPANASLLNLIATSTEVGLRNAITGTGTYLPMTFYTGGSERMRLDTSGNLLVGVTSADAKLSVYATNLTIPAISARYSAAGYKMGFGVYNVLGYPYLALNCNQVASSNNQTYDLSSFASKLDLAIDNTSGGFVFSTAASGTAGNTITWSERMRIDGSSGKITDQYGNIRAIPRTGSEKTSAYTLTVSDVGQFVQVGTSGSVTVPNDTFATGDVVSVFNNTTGNISINCPITTAYLSGTNTDRASLTLSTRGVATILFINPSLCVASGNLT